MRRTAGLSRVRADCGGVAVLLSVAAALGGSTVGAQSRPYYNITAIESKQIRNGVILTIKADGAMSDLHSHDWMYIADGSPYPVKQIELHAGSGKSQVGDFVNIGRYPVSHVELVPRSYDNTGVGLNLIVRLYTEARIRHFKTERFSGDWHWNPTMGCCFDGELGRDQQSFVLTVISDRFADPEPETGEPTTQELSLQPGPGGTYTLSTLNADLSVVADELGRRTGTRIVVDESVTKHVTVNLPEMTVPALLRGIAHGYGLALDEKGGQYVLSRGLPGNVATYETNITQVVRLENLSAEAAVDLLPNCLLAYLRPSEAQNALIVSGPEALIRRVREDVAKIDHPPQQLRVEVTAVKVASASAWQKALTANWGVDAGAFEVDPTRGSLSYQHLPQPADRLHADLRALEQTGAVDTLARAHVTLINGKWASLFLGQKRYIQVTRNTEEGDEQVAVPVDLGVNVGLAAWTGGQDVALWLHPVVTTLGGNDPVTGLPIVDRYETMGALIVCDRHTLLLGGVRLVSDRQANRGQPRWVPLPRERSATVEDSEIALFITVNLLDPSRPPGQQPFSGRLERELRDAGIEWRYEPREAPPS